MAPKVWRMLPLISVFCLFLNAVSAGKLSTFARSRGYNPNLRARGNPGNYSNGDEHEEFRFLSEKTEREYAL